MRRRVLLPGLGVPLLILAGSYAWLAVDHGTLGLWDVVVHESGRYTLGGTVLYYGHFLRELPTVTAYVLFLLGASGAVGAAPPAAPRPGPSATAPSAGAGAAGADERMPGRRLRGLGWAALLLAGGLVGFALVRAAGLHGWTSALLDLAQYRTRDDLVGYGTHWRYHWLSTLWFGCVAGLAPRLAARRPGGGFLAADRKWMGRAWGWFLLLTLVFGLSGEVFLDVRHAGHQAREILTHGPVTLLGGLALVALAGQGRRRRIPGSPPLPGWLNGGFAALALAIPLLLAAVALSGDVMEQGQSGHGLAAMVAAHYFEHSLDYLLAFLLLVGCTALVRFQGASPAVQTPPGGEDRDHGCH